MKTQVTWLSRRPFPGYFSVENVFQSLETELSIEFDLVKWVCPELSRGLWGRIKNVWLVSRLKGKLFHITGDVHFLSLGLGRKKTILTIHDLGYLDKPPSLSRFLFKWIWVILPVKQAARVTVISEESRQVVLKATGCDPDKVIVVPNPVHPVFHYSPNHNFPEIPTLLQVGVKANKNLERLVEAIRGMKVKLEILGNPSDRQHELLKSAGIDYHFQTNLSAKEVSALYHKCDLVVFVSTFEGFGLPIIEAQASGTPVIVSNIKPMSTVAGEGAIKVNPFEVSEIKHAIELLASDQQLRDQLIESGIENALKYSPKHIANLYSEVYRSVIHA